MPSEVRFAEVERLVRKHGWHHVRTRGSHFVFQLPDGTVFSIPVHHGKVKYHYVREIKKQLGEA